MIEATLCFHKFKVALNPTYRFKKKMLDCLFCPLDQII